MQLIATWFARNIIEQFSHMKTLLKALDINVWSGLDYIGTFTMGEYESDAVREKRSRPCYNR